MGGGRGGVGGTEIMGNQTEQKYRGGEEDRGFHRIDAARRTCSMILSMCWYASSVDLHDDHTLLPLPPPPLHLQLENESVDLVEDKTRDQPLYPCLQHERIINVLLEPRARPPQPVGGPQWSVSLPPPPHRSLPAPRRSVAAGGSGEQGGVFLGASHHS